MKKTILALAAAATIVVGTLSVPSPADAQRRGFWPGVGLGIITGVIVGTAITRHPGWYTYEDYDVDAGPGCYWARRAWRDQDGNVHYSRPRRFCD
jgi:hypothetical protein